MRIPTLYLDTSVLGGYFDDEWKQPTQELWRQMESGLWRFVTSLVAAEELIEAPDRVRDLFNSTFEAADVLNITEGNWGSVCILFQYYVKHLCRK